MLGGKDQYVCLLSLIQREARPLYDVICELCMDGTFRTQRYQNTFLMPSKELIKTLEKMVAADEDEAAIDCIRSLILKGHHSLDDFKKKDVVIGTLQSGSKVLKDPSAVGKAVKQSKKSVLVSKTGAPTFIVYEYASESCPETVEGKSGGMVLARQTMSGGKDDSYMKKVNEITQSMIVKDDATKTVRNFFKAVSGLLAQLQEEDENSFNNAKFYLAANPILSWYFLTMPGSIHGLVKESHLKDFEAVLGTDIIQECITKDYEFNKELFKKINRHRTQLINENGDKSSLMKNIKLAYQKMLPEMVAHKSINSDLENHVDLKILMDELRFMYEDCVKHYDDIDDALSALKLVNWSEPAKSHVLTSDDLYKKHMLKGTESFISGPVTFVKSVYFLYIPLTDAIEEQITLSKKKSGGISGGNPSSNNNIIFSGGAARKVQKKSADIKLESFVKLLSKEQKASLKHML